MNTRLSFLALVLLLPALACSKGNDGALPAASSSASSLTSVTTKATVPPPSASAAARPLAWQGTYKSVAGGVTIPESLKAGTWKNADASAALGEGTLSLAVDPLTNRVSGTLDGPLGPASVSGLFADGKITATVRRSDPADQGFAGTLEAAPAGGALSGTMNGALGQATAVRTATFSLSSAATGGGGVP
jgi:hypothetical protein